MMNKTILGAAAFATILSGCASLTPTTETKKFYEIHDVKVSGGVTAAKLSDAIKVALQKNVTGVVINTEIPPHPLPEQPGRFQESNPLKGTNLGAFAAMAGQSMQVVSCEGAIVTANASDKSMSSYGESTNFTLCLWPYKDGYHIDFHTTYTKTSGGVSTQALGYALTRSVMGDSSQFIPRTIKAVVDGVQGAGATVVLMEKYPN